MSYYPTGPPLDAFNYEDAFSRIDVRASLCRYGPCKAIIRRDLVTDQQIRRRLFSVSDVTAHLFVDQQSNAELSRKLRSRLGLKLLSCRFDPIAVLFGLAAATASRVEKQVVRAWRKIEDQSARLRHFQTSPIAAR